MSAVITPHGCQFNRNAREKRWNVPVCVFVRHLKLHLARVIPDSNETEFVDLGRRRQLKLKLVVVGHCCETSPWTPYAALHARLVSNYSHWTLVKGRQVTMWDINLPSAGAIIYIHVLASFHWICGGHVHHEPQRDAFVVSLHGGPRQLCGNEISNHCAKTRLIADARWRRRFSFFLFFFLFESVTT